MSRDKLVAWLWPEADGERARHLLADTIYVLRDAFGDDVILSSGNDLSLNPAVMSADVIEFTQALERGDRERAVKLYAPAGPFLDGIHVSDDGEFERWADSTRAQFNTDYRKALEQLALDASSRGDHVAAVAWWRQLAADDRLSSRVALGLMRALAAAGDRAGALDFARLHESIVRAELESPPDPAVAAFADQLRKASPHSPVAPPLPTLDATVGSATDPTSSAVSDAALPPGYRASDSKGTTSRPGSRRLVASAIGAAILALALLGGFRLRHRFASNPSIVVLPLRNLNGGASDESFADGMTDELIDALARTSRLRVIASTSAFAFKGSHADARAIADSLRVSNILEGDVQRDGERVRMRLRLVDARDGSTRWTESYDRDLMDVLTVEDEVSRAVAGELKARLFATADSSGHKPTHQTRNAVAYDLYLRGRHQRELRSDTGVTAAIEYFERAIAADSTYAAAYAGLGEASTLLVSATLRPLPESRLLLAQGETAALKAVALDDLLPEAHIALGFVRMNGRIDLSASEAELKRALSLDSTARRAHEYLSLLYDWMERPDEALAEARRAMELDPLSVTAIRELARGLFAAHRYDEALAQIERARSLGPPVRSAPIIAGQIYAAKGMYPQAIAELRAPHTQASLALLGHTLARAGQTDEAKRILADFRERWSKGTSGAYNVAVVYAGFRDFDQAFAWLDKSFDDLSIRSPIMDPTFEDLRRDPRFNRVRQRLGLRAR